MKHIETNSSEMVWDVVVIGGGPAGMMAAGRAAECGARALLLEKNKSLGKKLLITGGGRCNVTNAERDVKTLLVRFKEGGKYLHSPFSKWGVQNTIDFFHRLGVPTKEEAEQRVFPMSNSSQSVWDALVSYLKMYHVTVRYNAEVRTILTSADVVTGVVLKNGDHIRARSFVLATGGISHPETGSTGDGYRCLREIGHTVFEESAALVPIALNDSRVKKIAGVSMSDVKITLYQNDAKQEQGRGKILFTHVGLSGPAILNMSRDIGELLKYGTVELELDFLPDRGYEKVNEVLQTLFAENHNKNIRNALKTLAPTALAAFLIEAAQVLPETPCHAITRDERMRILKELKHTRFSVKQLLGLEKAVITAGGISLDEVDFRTMCSLKYPNLYVVGDILNINRPSGGYSLQICWTTGFVAGNSAAKSCV